MALEHSKSAVITNLDATPRIANQAGKGAPDKEKVVDAFVTVPASDDDSTHQFIRVPSTAIIKEVFATTPTQGATGSFNIGVYYASDLSNPLGLATLLAANAIDEDFFVAAFDGDDQSFRALAVPGMTETLAGTTMALVPNTAWTAAEAHKPLWEALGLSADPGGNFDIVLTNIEAVATGALVYMRVKYSAGI